MQGFFAPERDLEEWIHRQTALERFIEELYAPQEALARELNRITNQMLRLPEGL
jgi:hypothetical protein